MTPDKFKQIARSCSTPEELEQLKQNALSRGRKDFAEIADMLLVERFPVRTRKGNGATPSTVTFNGKRQRFPSGKAGYVWLVDQFALHRPDIYAEYEDFHRKRKSSGCRLARTPEGLYPAESSRANTASNYAAVIGNWYLDANINHVGKFALLLQLGHLAKLSYPTDWNFEIEGSTEGLSKLQEAIVQAEAMLQELLSM